MTLQHTTSPTACRRSGRAQSRTSAAGFTLIEIAITLTVFGVLLAIIAPYGGAWMANMQIRATAESIQAGLHKARMEAVRRNQPVRFSLVTTTNAAVMDNSCALSATAASWVVSVNDPAGKCGNALSDTADPMLVETYAAGVHANRITVAARQTDGVTAANTVVFDGFGRIAGAAPLAMININNVVTGDDFRPLRIVVADGGGIRLCDPRVAEATDPRRC